MRIIECQQGTDQWLLARLGKATASEFSSILAKGQGKTRRAYMLRLASERLTGQPAETYTNGYMQWGTENEPLAREYYEIDTDCPVQQIGFAELDEDTGASPDGLVGDEGQIEIKCPNTATHIDTILSDRVPPEYLPQIQGSLWVTGRKWCDFISFDPRMKTRQYWTMRVERDENYIENLASEVERFISELKKLVEQISNPF